MTATWSTKMLRRALKIANLHLLVATPAHRPHEARWRSDGHDTERLARAAAKRARRARRA